MLLTTGAPVRPTEDTSLLGNTPSRNGTGGDDEPVRLRCSARSSSRITTPAFHLSPPPHLLPTTASSGLSRRRAARRRIVRCVQGETQKKPASGFPSSIKYIIGNEFCERFSFYGMKGTRLDAAAPSAR